jgi:hypothetical protein
MFLLPLLIALEASPAGAATALFSVHGLKGVRSAVVVADDGSGAKVLPCRDDGQAPDSRIDGTWTCEPFTATGSKIWTALLTDGEAFRVGAVPISSSRLEVVLEKTGFEVVAEVRPQQTVPDPDAQAAGPGLILLTRMHSAVSQNAPMLQVQTEDMVVQHSCRDDGALFDTQLNDGLFLCSGFLPGPGRGEEFTTTISIRTMDGESRELATLSLMGGAGIRFAEIDESSEDSPETEGFSLTVQPRIDADEGDEPPPETEGFSLTVQPGSEGDEPPPETEGFSLTVQPGSEGGEPLPEVDGFSPNGQPGGASAEDPAGASAEFEPIAAAPTGATRGPVNSGTPSPPPSTGFQGLWRLMCLVLALALGLVWLRGRLMHQVPASLEPIGAPRLGRIGPRPAGEPIGLVVTDIPSALMHLVSHLSGHRRVILLGVDAVPDALPVGHPVYTVRNTTMADALSATHGLIRSPGAPVVVIIVRPGQLDPGTSVSPVALTEFYDALDALVWSVTLQGPQDETRPNAKRWVLDTDGSWSEG